MAAEQPIKQQPVMQAENADQAPAEVPQSKSNKKSNKKELARYEISKIEQYRQEKWVVPSSNLGRAHQSRQNAQSAEKGFQRAAQLVKPKGEESSKE